MQKKSVSGKVLKAICVLVVMSLLLSSFAACSGKPNTGNAASTSTSAASESIASTAPALEKYDLKVLTAGDTPPENDLVMQEISKVSEKELNINLSVTYTPWSDYMEKVKIMGAAGDKFDIFLNFLGELQGMISRKQALPLDDYLNNYGPDLKGLIGKSDWDDVTIDGKTYGVPSVYASVGLAALAYRQDLAEKYGITNDLNTLEDIEKYLDTVVKNEKGMIGYAAGVDLGSALVRAIYHGKGFTNENYYSYFGSWSRYAEIDTSVKPYKVVNAFKEPKIKAQAQWAAKAYANGWIEKDILIEKDAVGKFKAGKVAMVPTDLYNLPDIISTLKNNAPEGKVKLFVPYSEAQVYKNGPSCNNFASISTTSGNPERAMMFLNWLRKSQDNYDLYMLGIKGKHWNPVGDDKAELIGVTDMSKRPYNPTPWWTKQMTMDRALTTDEPAYIDALNKWKTMKYEVSPLIGFTVDNANFKVEQGQLETVVQEKYAAVINGIKSTDADFESAMKALDAAGIDKVVAEVQKQLDAWLAKNGK